MSTIPLIHQHALLKSDYKDPEISRLARKKSAEKLQSNSKSCVPLKIEMTTPIHVGDKK